MKTFAFIDASNLFYGGEKSLGWSIDYKKLIEYLKGKYNISEVFYFGGIDTFKFKFDYQNNHTVPLDKLAKFLNSYLRTKVSFTQKKIIESALSRLHFYQKLEKFGYKLYLKPVKIYRREDGTYERKANCDVEMAFYLMKERDRFDKVLVLSGDGDFLPVLKYLKGVKKEVVILSRGPRTAKEVRQFAGENFRDFVRLEKYIKFEK